MQANEPSVVKKRMNAIRRPLLSAIPESMGEMAATSKYAVATVSENSVVLNIAMPNGLTTCAVIPSKKAGKMATAMVSAKAELAQSNMAQPLIIFGSLSWKLDFVLVIRFYFGER